MEYEYIFFFNIKFLLIVINNYIWLYKNSNKFIVFNLLINIIVGCFFLVRVKVFLISFVLFLMNICISCGFVSLRNVDFVCVV